MGLTVHELRVVRAIGQVLFPRDRALDADGEDVDLEGWVVDYLGRMPPMVSMQIRALLRTFDVGFGVWALRPGASFVAGRSEEQLAYIQSWSESTNYTQRMLFEALWCVVAFGYVEQAEAHGLVAAGLPGAVPLMAEPHSVEPSGARAGGMESV
jgi:hypothetical protein